MGGPHSKISPLLGDEVGQRVAKTLKQPAGLEELIALLDGCGTDWDARDFYVHELAPMASLERHKRLVLDREHRGGLDAAWAFDLDLVTRFTADQAAGER